MKRLIAVYFSSTLVLGAAADVSAQAPPLQVQPQTTPAIAAQIQNKASGSSLEGVFGKNRLLKVPRALSPAEMQKALQDALKAPPPGLGQTVKLSATTPRLEWASLSSFIADFNAQFGFFGLNGRPQEKLVVAFKPQYANKPILVTIAVGQAIGGTGTPTLHIKGSGVSTTQSLPTTATHVHTVVTPTDTGWYKLELSSGPSTVLLITSVELTPTL